MHMKIVHILQRSKFNGKINFFQIGWAYMVRLFTFSVQWTVIFIILFVHKISSRQQVQSSTYPGKFIIFVFLQWCCPTDTRHVKKIPRDKIHWWHLPEQYTLKIKFMIKIMKISLRESFCFHQRNMKSVKNMHIK